MFIYTVTIQMYDNAIVSAIVSAISQDAARAIVQSYAIGSIIDIVQWD